MTDNGVTFENMLKVREQQESLARLHFELNAQKFKYVLPFIHHSFHISSNNRNYPVERLDSTTDLTLCDCHLKPNNPMFSKSNMNKLLQNVSQFKLFLLSSHFQFNFPSFTIYALQCEFR